MSVSPKYKILIQPHGSRSDLNKLLVFVTLEAPKRKDKDLLCCFHAIPDHPPHLYCDSNTKVTDSNGYLEVIFSTAKDGSIDIRVGRDTVGDVLLVLQVTPRPVDQLTSPKTYTELHCDQGGLIGVGRWFLPHLPYREISTCHVEWDLSLSPPKTKASWSFGEGAKVTTQTGPDDLLRSSVFMVGPIMSYQCKVPAPQNCGGAKLETDEAQPPVIHSFGELPASLKPLQEATAPIFSYVKSIFESLESVMKVYIRKVPRGFSGTNFASCFMIDYGDLDQPRHEAELLRYMSHEMTHNWAYLGNEPDGFQNMWFIEGIADFYALYLPVLAGVKGVEYFCQILDEFLTMYYTSPYLHTPLRQVPNDANGNIVSYRRGFMYLFLLDAQLRAVADSRGESTQQSIALHSTVMTVCRKHWKDGTTNLTFWRESLYPILGKSIVDAGLTDMMDGTVLEPNPGVIFPVAGKAVKLTQCEQATIELGFNETSLDTHIIEGLVTGSKAQLSGLRNGDQLLFNTPLSTCRIDTAHPFSFVVQRGKRKIQGKIYPQSTKTVLGYRTQVLE